MSARKVLLAVTIALACAVPAHADEGFGVATDLAGTIASTSAGLLPNGQRDIGNENVGGQCTFAGQTGLTGGIDYQYAGEAAAVSTGATVPEITVVTCTLTSPAQGLPGERPTLSATFTIACPLAACATADHVAGWPIRPVVVCVDGYSIFGPTPVVRKDIVHACRNSTLP